jgi:hypothetical protein
VRPNLPMLPAWTFPYSLHAGFQQKLLGATKFPLSIAPSCVTVCYGHATINRQGVDYLLSELAVKET